MLLCLSISIMTGRKRDWSRLESKYCGDAKRKRSSYRPSSWGRGILKVSSNGGYHAGKAT